MEERENNATLDFWLMVHSVNTSLSLLSAGKLSDWAAELFFSFKFGSPYRDHISVINIGSSVVEVNLRIEGVSRPPL